MVEFQDEVKESKSEIQRFLGDLKDANIGIENYKKYFEKVRNTDSVIITTIQSLSREHHDYKEEFDKLIRTERFKEMAEDGYVSKEIFDLARQMSRTLTEAYSWRTLQGEIYNIILIKIFQVLDDTKALDIKRDALQEMREMEKTRQELYLNQMESMGNLFREVVNNKIKHYDEKLFGLVKNNIEENRKERVDMFNCFEVLMNSNKDLINTNTRKEIKEMLSEAIKRTDEKVISKNEITNSDDKDNNDSDDGEFDESIFEGDGSEYKRKEGEEIFMRIEDTPKERFIDKEILRRRALKKKDPFNPIKYTVNGRDKTIEEIKRANIQYKNMLEDERRIDGGSSKRGKKK